MPETPNSAPIEVLAPHPPVNPWHHVAEALKRNPGEWRRITGHPARNVATTNIKHGVLAAFRPAGAYEAERRDGELWLRYIGSADDLEAVKVAARSMAGVTYDDVAGC